MTDSKITDLYEGKLGQIWIDNADPDDETVMVSLFGRITVAMSRDEFQEFYNVMIVARHTLTDIEKGK